MNTVNTVAMAPGGFGDGKKPPATSLGSQQVPLHFNFHGFGVCGFHGLAAIRKSLVHKNLDISVYARYSGWPNDVMHRKMALVIFTLPAISLLLSYYSSFAIVRFVLAGVEYVFLLLRSLNVATCQIWRRLVLIRWQQLQGKPEYGKELESSVRG